MNDPKILFKTKILDESEIKFIKDYILASEDYVKSLGPDQYVGTSSDSLGGRHHYFNYLYTPIGDILIPKLKELVPEARSIQCWANTYRKGEKIDNHAHGYNFICSNLFICGDPTVGTTYYENWEPIVHENVPGEMTVFNSELGHGTVPYPEGDVRITMAFDYHDRIMTNTNRFYNL